MRRTRTKQLAYLEGIALWAPTLPDWDTARAVLRGEREAPSANAKLPSAELLAPTERRRAPDTVVLSLHVATRAVSMSAMDTKRLKSVFVSAHGDLCVTHAICDTLARAPSQTSPTKFHHSVHNAASGYWGIATDCQEASTAVSALDCSFAAGLLEALCQCEAEARPVLLVAYDIEAVGALASVNDSRGMLAVALVLSPTRTARSLSAIEWAAQDSTAPLTMKSRGAVASGLSRNGMADALPFLEALARSPTQLSMPLSSGSAMGLCMTNLTHERAEELS